VFLDLASGREFLRRNFLLWNPLLDTTYPASVGREPLKSFRTETKSRHLRKRLD
jgi:hypothetical protein